MSKNLHSISAMKPHLKKFFKVTMKFSVNDTEVETAIFGNPAQVLNPKIRVFTVVLYNWM